MIENLPVYLGPCFHCDGGQILAMENEYQCSNCSTRISNSIQTPFGEYEITPPLMRWALNYSEMELPGIGRDKIAAIILVCGQYNMYDWEAKLCQIGTRKLASTGNNRIPCLIEKSISPSHVECCTNCPIMWEALECGDRTSWEKARSLKDDLTKDACFRDNDLICSDCSYLHDPPEHSPEIDKLKNCVEDLSLNTDEEIYECETCGLPIDRSYKSYLVSSDRIVSALAQCAECEAPLVEAVGDCPFCGDHVYEFEAGFACYNSVTGPCGFRISKEFMEIFAMYPLREHAYSLLHDGLQECDMETKRMTYTRIRTYEDGKWSFEISEKNILSSPLD